MGDRITIRFVDEDGKSTPQIYSHDGGFYILKKANRLLMDGQYNDFGNLACNLVIECMGGKHYPFGTYLYNDDGSNLPACDSRMWTFHAVEEMPNGWNGESHCVQGYWTSTWCGENRFTPEEIDDMAEEPQHEVVSDKH